MSKPELPYEPTIPLRLRWSRHLSTTSFHAFDGPWMVGAVDDHATTAISAENRFMWTIGILPSSGNPLYGYVGSRREAAETIERTYFDLLPKTSSFACRIEEQIAFCEFLGIPLPAGTAWLKVKQIDGENPLPLYPHKGQLALWGEEERRRGRRGILTPSLMREAYGEGWRE